MITLKIDHHKTFIENASDEQMVIIKKSLRIWQDFFNKGVDAKFQCTNLFYYKDKSFPTGFLSELKKKMDKHNIQYQEVDTRRYKPPSKKFHIDKKFSEGLWENQELALVELEAHPTGFVSSPTGTGKTRILVNAIDQRRVKTLVIVPSTSIQKQVHKLLTSAFGAKYISSEAPKWEAQAILNKLKVQETDKRVPTIVDDRAPKYVKKINFGDVFNEDGPEDPARIKKRKEQEKIEDPYVSRKLQYQKQRKLEKEAKRKAKYEEKRQAYYEKLRANHGKISFTTSQAKQVYGHDITVVCYQSLPLLSQDFLDSIEFVIIDECHHSSAETIRLALDKMPNACYRYGVSATPWRDKNDERKLLIAALGNNVLYEISASDAIAKGIVVPPELIYINCPQPDKYLGKYRYWRDIVDNCLVGNLTRNQEIVRQVQKYYKQGHNIFICVDEISHINNLKDLLKEKNIDILEIHGQQRDKINDRNIKTVGESDGPLVSIGTMAVGEGTDMPNISVIILAAGGKSSIKFLQRIGRGTRKTGKKESIIVIDFEDWFNPTTKKHWFMRKDIFRKYYKLNI